MKLSSFIAITAAGLAVALPVTPTPTGLTNPFNAEKKLTVEPSEAVAKRQVDALGAVTSGLPVARRQLDGLLPSDDSEEEEKDVEPKEPKEPKEPADPTEDGKTTVDEENTVQTAGDVSKRQLDGLMKMLQGKKEPADNATAPAAGDVAKRQLDGLMKMLQGDKEDKKPAANATTPAEAPAEKSDAPEPKESKAAPADPEASAPAKKEEEPKSGLAGILKRQLSGLPGTSDAAEDEEPESTDLVNPKQLTSLPIRRQLEGLLDKSRNESTPEDPEADAAAAPADKEAAPAAEKKPEDEAAPAEEEDAAAAPAEEEPASGLGGILKRQLDGLLGDDKEDAPAEEEDAAEPKEDAAAEEEPAADDAAAEPKDDAAAAPEEPAEKDETLLGMFGLTQQSQAEKAAAKEEEAPAEK